LSPSALERTHPLDASGVVIGTAEVVDKNARASDAPSRAMTDSIHD
jgi:hypothetical protein